MTTTRPVPALSHLGRLDRVAAALCLGLGAPLPLFQPGCDSVPGYAKGPFKPTQTTAFLIGTKDFSALLGRMSIRCWRLTALSTAGAAFDALLAIRGVAVVYKPVASAEAAHWSSTWHKAILYILPWRTTGHTTTSSDIAPLPRRHLLLPDSLGS